MATIESSVAREFFPDVIELAQSEAVTVGRHRQPVAVFISPESYAELIEALEEIRDIAAFDAAFAEEGTSIPWEQVNTDLGWQ